MVTLADVAKAAGVSTSTISRVVRGKSNVGKKTRTKVQKVIDELGYKPDVAARALASQKSELLGIITPYLHKPFYGYIVHTAEQSAIAQGYQIVIRNYNHNSESEITAINSLIDQGCENIIIHSQYLTSDQLEAFAIKLPGLVIINRFIPSLAERCVWLDNFAAGKLIADYMLSQGHKFCAVVNYWEIEQNQSERIAGIKHGFSHHGYPICDELIITPQGNRAVEDPELYCENAVELLCKSAQNYTAIIAYNDELAIHIVNILSEFGKKVPEDISVLGFDDIGLADFCSPTLTTIHYPIIEMAEYAVQLSINLTNSIKQQHKTHQFMPNLVKRLSVSAI